MLRNSLLGLLVAAALAVSASDITLFGIDAWKIVLAALGVAVFAMGGSGSRRRR